MNDKNGEDQQDTARQAGREADAAVLRIARQAGAELRQRPALPGAASTISYAEPGTGLAAARALELAAIRQAKDYVRHAREDGMSWRDIGAALGVGADSGGGSAGAAYDYAAGDAAGRPSWSYDRSFRWICPSCDGAIRDQGPEGGRPEDAEPGHAAGCGRLAATSAAYDAAWEQAEREWEAGQ